MRLPLRLLSPVAVALAEALGFGALLLAPEVEKVWVWAPVALALPLWLVGLRLSNRRLLVAAGCGLALTLYSAAGLSQEALVVAICRALVPAHALLWLARDALTYRYWRLGLAFVAVVLAAILAPEAYMFVIIFLLVVAAAMALSFGFIERNFTARGELEALRRPVRASFVGAILLLSVLLFLTSLVIFPLLPRTEGVGPLAETGYTEVVNFHQSTLGWAGGNPRPVAWIFLPPGENWQRVLPYGLLRGKVLEKFVPMGWRALPKQRGTPPEGQGGPWVEIYREPMPTEILPVPYGTVNATKNDQVPVPYSSGEWAISLGQGRLHYRAQLSSGGFALRDTPRPENSELPASLVELKRLAADLGRGATGEEEKVSLVRLHLAGFQAQLEAMSSVAPGRRHPVETFLFETKRGHCELFATAGALLLRGMGVPTRLVAGFRPALTENTGEVLTVKNLHAHAWIEYWDSRRGWRVLDPTPVIPAPAAWWEPAERAYDWISAYWHRYILGYELDMASWLAWVREYIWIPLLLVCSIALWRLSQFWRRQRATLGRPRVTAIRRRLSRRLGEDWLPWAESAHPNLAAEYEALRYGQADAEGTQLKKFEARARAAIPAGGGSRP